MTIAAMRERLHEMIDEATDGEIPFIMEDLKKTNEPYEWSEDEVFIAEMDEDIRRVEAGIDRGYTLEDVKAEFAKLREERSSKTG